MNNHLFITSALASALAIGLTGPVAAQAKAKEKCFGIAKAGQNDCANLSGSHSCAGQSKAEKGLDEFRYVPTGTCKELNGNTEQEARLTLGK
ncbi:MAG: DUF2282 domain-containing protein [Variovorax sp.]